MASWLGAGPESFGSGIAAGERETGSGVVGEAIRTEPRRGATGEAIGERSAADTGTEDTGVAGRGGDQGKPVEGRRGDSE